MRLALVIACVLFAACGGDFPSDDAARAKVPCACDAGFGVERELSGGGTTCDCTGAAGQALCTPGDDSACGVDETCRSTGGSNGACLCACDDTWSCDGACACDPECTSTEVKCDADPDCDAAACEVCVDRRCVPACEEPQLCDGAGSCVAAACEGPLDCYPTGYCTSGAYCEDVAPLAACRAAATFSPSPEPNGPVLFGGGQVDLLPSPGDAVWCQKEPATCINNGNVCAWRLRWFDPDGDVGGTLGSLYPQVRFLRPSDGSELPPYNVTEIGDGTFVIQGCYDEATIAPSGGALLYDTADHRSNPVCLAGQAP